MPIQSVKLCERRVSWQWSQFKDHIEAPRWAMSRWWDIPDDYRCIDELASWLLRQICYNLRRWPVMRDVVPRRMGPLNFVELGGEKILHILYRLGFVVQWVSCRYSGERKECMRVFLEYYPVDFSQLKYQLEIHSGKKYVRRKYARK